MEKKDYYNQLDSLRTICAFGVINLHWFIPSYLALFGLEYHSIWEFGHYGVQVFFVLSGFLITNILIRHKNSRNKLKVIKNFYVRRALRLFPIYYLFLIYLLVVIIGDKFISNNIGWFLTYTANIKFYITGGLVDVWSNHLWTLSVEEQFYLLFPIIFLFIPKRFEYWLAIFFIFSALTFKYLSFGNGQPTALLTFAQMDMLGVGVLIAVLKNRHKCIYLSLANSWVKIIILITITLSLWIFYFQPTLSRFLDYILLISFGLIVANTAIGFNGVVGYILNNRVLQYLGRISYGLYLYHKIIPLSLIIILNKLDLRIENIVVYYITNLSILLICSHISWKLIESPILSLKSKFI